jgi:cation transport regulator ChaB
VNSSPPFRELDALAERLQDVSYLLHEIADRDQAAIAAILKASRKATPGQAVRTAARHCRLSAERRFSEKLRSLEQALAGRGWKAKCFSRALNESDSVYWPAREVAVLVEIVSFERDMGYADEALNVAQECLGGTWRFRVVPVMNGRVLASMALMPVLGTPLPDQDFARTWQPHLSQPFLVTEVEERFDAALVACMQVSGIIACRDLEHLHRVEEEAISKAIESFKDNRDSIERVSREREAEHLAWVVRYLDETWAKVVWESEAAKAGTKVKIPLCVEAQAVLAGQRNERSNQLAAARMMLLEAECASSVK